MTVRSGNATCRHHSSRLASAVCGQTDRSKTVLHHADRLNRTGTNAEACTPRVVVVVVVVVGWSQVVPLSMCSVPSAPLCVPTVRVRLRHVVSSSYCNFVCASHRIASDPGWQG